MLDMLHISKAFAGVRVLDDVPFHLRRGEVHILAGENGAGKTTLIRILGGVYTEYEGEIRLDSRRLRLQSPHHAAACGISVIHQELSLVRSMSVLDNLFLGREKTRGPWVDRRAQVREAEELVARLGLDLDVQRTVEDYPLSVQQMIEIAKALAFRAQILVMDEPTSALNEVETDRLFHLIAALRAQGCGVIYISHRMEEIYRIGDRITVLRDGRSVGTAAARDLPAEDLIRWMTGREISRQFPPRATPRGPARLSAERFSVPDPAGARGWSVSDVSLTVHAGEILGVAGLQGSGKTDLLMGLFGAGGKRTRGSVTLDGRPYAPGSPREAMRQGVALVTNDRKDTGLVLGMDVTQNITLASVPRFSPCGWLHPARERRAAMAHAESLAIRLATFTQEVQTLSGGNQQKVVLAKWLETCPKVLLLDEPTRGVDVGAKHDIYALMNRWTADGIAILLLTSELEELLAMSDRILVLHRGRVTAELARADATREKVLQAAMGGVTA